MGIAATFRAVTDTADACASAMHELAEGLKGLSATLAAAEEAADGRAD